MVHSGTMSPSDACVVEHESRICRGPSRARVLVNKLSKDTIMYTNVNHASFTVSSVEKAVKFYVYSLGMKLIDISERDVAFTERVTGIPSASMRIAYVSVADFKIELIEYLTSRGEKLDTRTCNVGSAHICFNVDELDAMYAEMSTKGVKFISTLLPASIS